MPDNKGRIKRSRLLSHPLGGRAGLVREIGASLDHGSVFDAWARGLGGRQLWICPPRIDSKDGDVATFTTFIHDEATQSLSAGLRRYEDGTTISSM